MAVRILGKPSVDAELSYCRYCSLRRLTLFRKNVTQGRSSVEDTRRWSTGSCSQLGLSISEMKYTEMNECWQGGPVFFLLGRLVTCINEGGGRETEKKGLEEGGKRH